MNSLEFFVGGYFGISHMVYINAKLKNKKIKYARCLGGMFVDLKRPKKEISIDSEVKIKEVPLNPEQ